MLYYSSECGSISIMRAVTHNLLQHVCIYISCVLMFTYKTSNLGADYMSRVVPACRVDSAKRVAYEIAITCTRPTGLSLLITI